MLKINYQGFVSSLSEIDTNINLYIPFGKEYYARANQVLLKRLKDLEGVVWQKV